MATNIPTETATTPTSDNPTPPTSEPTVPAATEPTAPANPLGEPTPPDFGSQPNVPVAPESSKPTTLAAPAVDPLAMAAAAKEAVTVATKAANEAWYTSMELRPEDQKYIEGKKYGSIQDLLTSHRNLEKFAHGAKNVVAIPDAASPDEAWSDFYTKLGCPQDPAGYKIANKEYYQPGFIDWFQKEAFNHGLSQDQATGLLQAFPEFQKAGIEQAGQASAQEVAKQQDELKKEWGTAYNQNANRATTAYNAMGFNDVMPLSEFVQKLGPKAAGKIMLEWSKSNGEDKFVSGDGSVSGLMTPEEAKAEIKAINENPEYLSKKNPALIERMQRLMIMAHPDKIKKA